jgi:hypothetical protein
MTISGVVPRAGSPAILEPQEQDDQNSEQAGYLQGYENVRPDRNGVNQQENAGYEPGRE